MFPPILTESNTNAMGIFVSLKPFYLKTGHHLACRQQMQANLVAYDTKVLILAVIPPHSHNFTLRVGEKIAQRLVRRNISRGWLNSTYDLKITDLNNCTLHKVDKLTSQAPPGMTPAVKRVLRMRGSLTSHNRRTEIGNESTWKRVVAEIFSMYLLKATSVATSSYGHTDGRQNCLSNATQGCIDLSRGFSCAEWR